MFSFKIKMKFKKTKIFKSFNELNVFFTKKFAVYLFRWLVSAFVMMPFMMLFEHLGISIALNLILGQIIGALIFFKIDSLIFQKL